MINQARTCWPQSLTEAFIDIIHQQCISNINWAAVSRILHPDWPFYCTSHPFIIAHDSVDCADCAASVEQSLSSNEPTKENIIFDLYALIPKCIHAAYAIRVYTFIILKY